MITTKLLRCKPLLVCISLSLAIPAFKAEGQIKNTAKVAAAANKVTLKGGISFAYDRLMPAGPTSDDAFAYCYFQIPISISGKTPSSNFPIKLTIDDRSSAQPQFSSQTGFSTTLALPVDKALFDASGGVKDALTAPVVIRFNKKLNKGGHIYIQIDKQPEYYDLDFSPAPVKATQPAKETITLVDDATELKLDTFINNTTQQIKVNLKFDITKATRGDSVIAINEGFSVPSKNVKFANDNQKNSYPVTITTDNWKAGGAIVKQVAFSVQQTSAVTDTAYVALTYGPNTYRVKLLPFVSKSKAKASLKNLVKSGDAELISNKVGISHFYNSTLNAIDSIQFNVKIYGSYDSTHSVLSFALLDTSLNKHFQIWPNPDTITSREWRQAQTKYMTKYNIKANRADSVGILAVPLKIKTIKLNDSLNNVHYIDVILNGQNHINGGSQKIKLSIKDKPFWAEVGTNFDLLDKIKTNNFYAGVYMFDKDIAKIGRDSLKANNLSFTAGVYESQSTSSRSTSAAGIAYRDINSVHRDTGGVGANTSVKSIGILFSPHLKLTNGQTDANGLHVFVSLYTELLWQTVSTSFDYSKMAKKDSIISSANFPSGKNISSYPYKENTVNYDFRSHYFGLGIPIYIKESQFNLYINTVFGISNQKFYVKSYKNEAPEDSDPLTHNYITDLTFLNPNKSWNGFYLVQYRLNEVAYGITFSGEVRGLLLRGAKPVVTLALSKKFDLSALLKPLVAPF